MENPINKLFESLTDDELRDAINQIREDEPLGIIRIEGKVRDLTRKVNEITGDCHTMHLTMVQMSLFREAAYRFS